MFQPDDPEKKEIAEVTISAYLEVELMSALSFRVRGLERTPIQWGKVNQIQFTEIGKERIVGNIAGFQFTIQAEHAIDATAKAPKKFKLSLQALNGNDSRVEPANRGLALIAINELLEISHRNVNISDPTRVAKANLVFEAENEAAILRLIRDIRKEEQSIGPLERDFYNRLLTESTVKLDNRMPSTVQFMCDQRQQRMDRERTQHLNDESFAAFKVNLEKDLEFAIAETTKKLIEVCTEHNIPCALNKEYFSRQVGKAQVKGKEMLGNYAYQDRVVEVGALNVLEENNYEAYAEIMALKQMQDDLREIHVGFQKDNDFPYRTARATLVALEKTKHETKDLLSASKFLKFINYIISCFTSDIKHFWKSDVSEHLAATKDKLTTLKAFEHMVQDQNNIEKKNKNDVRSRDSDISIASLNEDAVKNTHTTKPKHSK